MKKKTFIAVCMFALWMALILPAMPSSVQAAKGGGGVRVSAPKSLPAPKAVTPKTGSVMRGVGLFAGGMFLGSMLSHFFGWGSLGWGADILGLLVNIFIFYLVIKGITSLWRWLCNRRSR